MVWVLEFGPEIKTEHNMNSEENQIPELEYSEYKIYAEERKILIEAEKETAQQFDKYVLTLAAGALALSITFINQIAPKPIPSSLWVLLLAWSLFSLSILSTLLSLLTSQRACRRQIEILEQRLKGQEGENRYAWWTIFLNRASIGLFVSGTFALIIFTGINMLSNKGEENMADTETTTQKPVEKIDKGFVPPVTPGFVPPKQPIKPPSKEQGGE